MYYRGQKALSYEADRIGDPQWDLEHRTVAGYLNRVQPSRVLDVPVGTGRFLPLYAERDCKVIGIDVSDDMLEQAKARAAGSSMTARLEIGDVTNLDFPDASFDLVICVRLLNLLDFDTYQKAIAELARVALGHLVLGLRLKRPPFRRGDNFLDSLEQFGRWGLRRLRGKRSLARNHPHPEALALAELARHGLVETDRRLINRLQDSSRYYLVLVEKEGSTRS